MADAGPRISRRRELVAGAHKITQSNPKQWQDQGCHYGNTDKAQNQGPSRSHKLQHVRGQRHVTYSTRRVYTNTALREAILGGP